MFSHLPSMWYDYLFKFPFIEVVMKAFKKYAKSSRVILRPDPAKIESLVGQKLKNWAYNLSRSDLKKEIPKEALEKLKGINDCMHLRPIHTVPTIISSLCQNYSVERKS